VEIRIHTLVHALIKLKIFFGPLKYLLMHGCKSDLSEHPSHGTLYLTRQMKVLLILIEHDEQCVKGLSR
jgi:hypothetical protein